jgi:hypothetical protein
MLITRARIISPSGWITCKNGSWTCLQKVGSDVGSVVAAVFLLMLLMFLVLLVFLWRR